MTLEFITPNWSAPTNIKCVTTTRKGGFSINEYRSLNLGGHVKDSIDLVNQNRQLLQQQLQLPREPVWLNQVHGAKVLELNNSIKFQTADAAFANESGVVCAVLTADCLPVVFCDQQGQYIAVAHAGWRGLVNGVLENTLQTIPVANEELLCWLGPAIGPKAFEVGKEVVDDFINKDGMHENAFQNRNNEKYLANIYQLAKNVLTKNGVLKIYGGDHCTYTESEKFYSYRRDGETGRMATLVWM